MSILYTPQDIKIRDMMAGEDRIVMITGGKAHIGAVSTAYMGHERIEVQTQQLPGHKEAVLTEELAVKGARTLGRTCSVAAGIHYDELSQEQIAEIVGVVHDLFDKYLASVREDS